MRAHPAANSKAGKCLQKIMRKKSEQRTAPVALNKEKRTWQIQYKEKVLTPDDN
jgi:hypothetical protein